MTGGVTTIAAFAGSLRKASFNRMLLRAVIELAPPDIRIDRMDIDDLPLFNGDLEDDENPLPPVKRLWESIRAADALLIVSPEYNYSIPAVTKNVLDWASRGDGVLDDKAAAVIGTSPGAFGTVRMQFHLRQVGVAAGLQMVVDPQLTVTHARQKFDAAGALTDERVRKDIVELLDKLAWLAMRLKPDVTKG
jgi:chromate reductase